MTESPPRKECSAYATVGGKDVFFSEDWATGIGGGLWSTGDALAKYFGRHSALIRRDLTSCMDKGKSMEGCSKKISAIELGSGNGYLSVCLAAIAGDLISILVCTDLSDHLPLMEKTLALNGHLIDLVDIDTCSDKVNDEGDNNTYVAERTKAAVTEHKWGVPEGEDSINNKFDLIFGSDLAYRDELHSPLIASIDRLSHENTVTLIGVTMVDTKPSFFDALTKAGFRYDRLSDYLLESEFRGTTFGIFVITRSKLKPVEHYHR